MDEGKVGDLGVNVDQILDVSEPKILNKQVELKEITERSLILRFDNYAVFVKRSNKGYRISVWSESGGKVVPEFMGEVSSLLDIDNLDLDGTIKEVVKAYVASWDTLLEKNLAEIILTGTIKTVPRTPTDKEVMAYEIARKLVEDLNVAVLKMGIGGKVSRLGLYCYDGVAWIQCEERVRARIGSYLQTLQMVRATKNVVNEVVENKIEMINTKVIEASEKPMVAFSNCVLDWDLFMETGDVVSSLRSPSPDLYVFHRVPHNLDHSLVKEVKKGLEVYIPPRSPDEVIQILKVLAPRVYGLLRSWAYYPNIGEDLLKSRISFLLEIIGRAMLPGYRIRNTIVFKDIFILLGPSNSGKSTFLTRFLCEAVLGEENCKTTKLRYLGSDDEETLWRTLGQLYNALAVILPDVGKNDRVSDWSVIRSISGGDYVQARRLRENPFEYYPHYKFYIASNDPPPINETGDARQALLRRIKAMEFKNVFTENPDFSIQSVVTEEEVEALILCSIYAIRLAYQRGCRYSFTGVYDVEDVWNRYTYPEYRLVMEMVEKGILVISPDRSISTRDLYNLVLDYTKNACREGKTESEEEEEEEEEECQYARIPSQNQFTTNLKVLLSKFGVKAVNRKNQTYFKGIGVAKQP